MRAQGAEGPGGVMMQHGHVMERAGWRYISKPAANGQHSHSWGGTTAHSP